MKNTMDIKDGDVVDSDDGLPNIEIIIIDNGFNENNIRCCMGPFGLCGLGRNSV